MEGRCIYTPSKDAIIYGIVNVWSAQNVAEFFKNKAAEWGFEADTVNSRSRTALHLLTTKTRSERDNEVIKVLLEFGADPLYKDLSGKSPLFRIMLQKRDSKLMVEFLKKLDDINVTIDAVGQTPLHMAVDTENVGILLYLMSRNPNLDITTPLRGLTPLHEAALANDPDLTRILLKNGADVNFKAHDGETPIFAALEENDSIEQVEILLEYGADLTARDNAGRTPLHALCASEVGVNPDILKMLLEAGADPNATDEMGRTPLEHCMRNEVTHMDVEHSVMVADLLTQHGAKVNEKNGYEQTLLHVASMSCPCALIKYLIYKGADTEVLNGENKTFMDMLKLRYPCWRKVLQMLVLQEGMGKFTFGENLQRSIQTDVKYTRFVEGARKELRLLRECQTGNDGPSRFDLLVSSDYRATRLCENEDIRAAMSSMHFPSFPIFGCRLKVKYEEACSRACAEHAAEEFFFDVSNGRLNRYAAENIIRYIPTESLLNIKKCHEDMKRERKRKL